ncbi:MAG: ATP phosphoribosyltransferase regulatory subunit, partial [Alphaproteobacteria bacterium]
MDSHAIDNILPAGFEDLLPPLAAIETTAVSSLCNTFADFGFQQVKPPLLEYVNTLHSETGETIADSLFETQDPLSSQSLALRADITVQIARIAATR